MSRWDDEIRLVSRKITRDDVGRNQSIEVETPVYANRMTVGITEFYAAGNAGMKAERQFQIHSFEYEGESELIHKDNNNKDIRYKVNRASERGDKTILVCERVVGSGKK